jgi:hypothetical protein
VRPALLWPRPAGASAELAISRRIIHMNCGRGRAGALPADSAIWGRTVRHATDFPTSALCGVEVRRDSDSDRSSGVIRLARRDPWWRWPSSS